MKHGGEWMVKTEDAESFTGWYPTREAAIDEAPEVLGLKPGEAFEIAQAAVYVAGPVDAEQVLEQLREQAYDAAGEGAEDYLEVEREDEQELARLLTEVFEAWSTRHGYGPRFYVCHGEETHRAPAAPPASGLDVLVGLLDPAKVSNVTVTWFCLTCGKASCAGACRPPEAAR